MNKEEHIAQHKILHRHLDELIADWIQHTGKFPSKSTVLELMTWSNEQTTKPSVLGDEK